MKTFVSAVGLLGGIVALGLVATPPAQATSYAPPGPTQPLIVSGVLTSVSFIPPTPFLGPFRTDGLFWMVVASPQGPRSIMVVVLPSTAWAGRKVPGQVAAGDRIVVSGQAGSYIIATSVLVR